MNDIQIKLEQLLSEFDASIKPFSEWAVCDAIRQLPKDTDDSSLPNLALKAESMAFGFLEDYRDKCTDWKTYYGPIIVWKDENGKWREFPSISQITREVLEYWRGRAGEAKHPILRSRYADLVWNFTRGVLGTSPNVYHFARLVIDETLKIAEQGLCEHASATITKLERALSLSLSINDSTRIAAVRDAMMALNKSDLCVSFGFSFDNLVGKRGVNLSQEHEDTIIFELESHLQRASGSENNATLNPFDAEEAAMRLAKYYESKGRTEDKRRVLRLYGHAYIAVSEKADGLVGSSWLQKVFEVFYENGMRDDADALTERIREMNKKSSEEMHAISTEIKISRGEIEQYIAEMTNGTLDEALTRIAWRFIPNPDEIKKQIKKQATKTPFIYLVARHIKDEDGRSIAQIGPLHEDMDGHVVTHTSQGMQIDAVFLRMLLEKLMLDGWLRVDIIMNYLLQSPVYDNERRGMIEMGIDAYLHGNHIVATHILIPQIEHTLRNLIKLTGGSAFKPARNGGLLLRNLDEILRDECVVKSLGEAIAHYLRVLLTDQRGWNLRNDICHGLKDPNTFSPTMGDRLIHVLLVMAQVREQRTPTTQTTDD